MSGSLSPIAARTAAQPAPLRAPMPGAAPSEAAMRRAAQSFESQVMGLLLQPIFATVDPSRSRFGGGAAESQWRPMLVDAYAAAATRAGGFGIADMVFRHMQRAAQRSDTQAAPHAATPTRSPTP